MTLRARLVVVAKCAMARRPRQRAQAGCLTWATVVCLALCSGGGTSGVVAAEAGVSSSGAPPCAGCQLSSTRDVAEQELLHLGPHFAAGCAADEALDDPEAAPQHWRHAAEAEVQAWADGAAERARLTALVMRSAAPMPPQDAPVWCAPSASASPLARLGARGGGSSVQEQPPGSWAVGQPERPCEASTCDAAGWLAGGRQHRRLQQLTGTALNAVSGVIQRNIAFNCTALAASGLEACAEPLCSDVFSLVRTASGQVQCRLTRPQTNGTATQVVIVAPYAYR